MKRKLYSAFPTTAAAKTKRYNMVFFGLGKHRTPQLSGLLKPVGQVASSEWSLEDKKALQQVQAAVHAALALGPESS